MLFPTAARTNYVIACWSGWRIKERNDLVELVPFLDDSLGYVKKQMGCLAKYRHSISQITLAIPYNPNRDCPYHRRFMAHVEQLDGTTVGGAKVRVFWREYNEGQSYASWANVAKVYKDFFDYYIFTEDDYVPVVDGWDEILRSQYDTRNCDYLLIYKHNDIYATIGIIGHRGLRRHGYEIPYQHPTMPMVRFVRGLTTEMVSPPWASLPFFGAHKGYKGIFFFGEEDQQYLFAPTQMVSPETFSVVDLSDKMYTVD